MTLRRRAGADFAAADDERDVDPLGRHGGEPRLERGAFGRAWRVGLDRLVDGRGTRRWPLNIFSPYHGRFRSR